LGGGWVRAAPGCPWRCLTRGPRRGSNEQGAAMVRWGVAAVVVAVVAVWSWGVRLNRRLSQLNPFD